VRDAARGSSSARGYDATYARNRKVILDAATHCALCGDPFAPDEAIHIDHRLPLSKGGTSELVNLQASHATCNLQKSNRP
jgi:5-methylcytosine-specific restriction endonuclease McrA